MNAEGLFDFMAELARDELALMQAKNHDYAGETGDTPFRNFMECESLGICDAEAGLMVRICDKVSRMATLLKADAKVSDESFTDTASDLRNYIGLLLALRKARAELSPEVGSISRLIGEK